MPKKKSRKRAVVAETSAQEDNWRAESDMRTLMEAEQIKADRSRLSKAKTAARKQMAAVNKVVKKK